MGVFQTACAEYGTEEYSGDRSNPRIVEYNQYVNDLSRAEKSTDKTAWCSCFVNWVLDQNDIEGTASASARSFVEWGVPVDLAVAQKGDIIVLSRGRNPYHGHVTFYYPTTVELLDQNIVLGLGGNQSNQVNVKAYNQNRILAIVRPKYDLEVEIVEIQNV